MIPISKDCPDKKNECDCFLFIVFFRADLTLLLFFIGKIYKLRTAVNCEYAVCYPIHQSMPVLLITLDNQGWRKKREH